MILFRTKLPLTHDIEINSGDCEGDIRLEEMSGMVRRSQSHVMCIPYLATCMHVNCEMGLRC